MTARRSLIMLEILWHDQKEDESYGEPEFWEYGKIFRADDPESPVKEVRCMKVEDISPGGEPV